MTSILLVIIYLAFISLGLPDELLGSAWPVIYEQFGVALSSAGIISMIISGGTIVSSLFGSRITRALGTGKVTAISVGITAVALLGFSSCTSFWMMCLWAVPYGLGAGCIDTALNNYVALHYESRHMSWLHCMWGIGATAGPYIMGAALTNSWGWPAGYRIVGIIQIALTAAVVFTLPLWNEGRSGAEAKDEPGQDGAANDTAQAAETATSAANDSTQSTETKPSALSIKEVIAIPGAVQVMLCFFCYCALENTCGLWSATYLTLARGISAQTAASYAGLFFIGITLGRALNGFLSIKFTDDQLIRLGLCVLGVGVLLLFVPGPDWLALGALVCCGFGCAPIYPSIIHSTPTHFGEENSLALIGVQMASAYVGSCFMPPVFGLIANNISAAFFPVYLLVLLCLMAFMHTQLLAKTAH